MKEYEIVQTKKIDREILFFIVYAFSIPLICICLMQYIPACSQGCVKFILYGIEGASPSIAAIITILQKYGIQGIRCFILDKYKNGFNLKFCIMGFLMPAALLTVGKLLTYVTPYHNQFITLLSLKKIIIVTWALIAEELGWRGYLQDKIEKIFLEKLTPLIVGFIWSTWHYHFFLSGTMEVPIVTFTYGCIAESCGYYVITKLAKGNIVPASLWHFSGNLFSNLYLLNPNWNNGSIIPYIIVNTLYVLYIGAFIYYRKMDKKENYEL